MAEELYVEFWITVNGCDDDNDFHEPFKIFAKEEEAIKDVEESEWMGAYYWRVELPVKLR